MNLFPVDIVHIINQFLYWDLTSIRFAKYLAAKQKNTLHLIKTAISRKNGFGGQEQNDTLDPHWIFYTTTHSLLCLQAMNCTQCGNYIVSNTIYNNQLEDKKYLNCFCENH
jgi:hypothetical protein